MALAEREGFRSVEHLKRYTTLGMATDQGKTSNVNGLALMAELTGQSRSRRPAPPPSGRPSRRSPSAPSPATHRGKDFGRRACRRRTRWAPEQGAVFVETRLLAARAVVSRPGETDWLESVNREVRTVRARVGVCDVSTLGKIDVQGADAAEFLDRLYTNSCRPSPSARRATA